MGASSLWSQLDNVNVFVHYEAKLTVPPICWAQYVIQIGFECDTWQQLNFEFQTSETTNQLWGSGTDK